MNETLNEPTAAFEDDEQKPVGKIILGVIAFIVVVQIGLVFYWSMQPPQFDVEARARERTGIEEGPLPKGAVTISTVIGIAETLLGKPGGYLNNDVTPPSIFMDNMPNWETGALTELRDSARSLRNDFSRSQSQSIENPLLYRADSQFSFNSRSWILPSTEGEYRRGIAALEEFLGALVGGEDQTARFFARADNLRYYLQVVEKRLGSYAQLLSASVADEGLIEMINSNEAQNLERTPWNEIDDRFFQARGYMWALLHMMEALAIDFADVIETKNATVSMQQIIRDLRGASAFKRSPVVLNGHGFGLLANHSLVLASFISRANAAVIDLRVVLERG